MKTLKSKFDIVLEKLHKEGKVTAVEKQDEIIEKISKDLEDYRFRNQKKIKDSQEEITTIVLTA
jgi:hypothetical protein